MSGFLSLKGVSKRFGQHEVLESISLDVERGEFLTLLGESGSGKTTLLRILAGFEQATAGNLLLEGKPLLPLAPHSSPDFGGVRKCDRRTPATGMQTPRRPLSPSSPDPHCIPELRSVSPHECV